MRTEGNVHRLKCRLQSQGTSPVVTAVRVSEGICQHFRTSQDLVGRMILLPHRRWEPSSLHSIPLCQPFACSRHRSFVVVLPRFWLLRYLMCVDRREEDKIFETALLECWDASDSEK